MGLRFRRSIKIMPGVRLNLGKRGLSMSVGRPGATVNISSRGTRTTVGIPGTGISYSSTSGGGTRRSQPTTAPVQAPAQAPPPTAAQLAAATAERQQALIEAYRTILSNRDRRVSPWDEAVTPQPYQPTPYPGIAPEQSAQATSQYRWGCLTWFVGAFVFGAVVTALFKGHPKPGDAGANAFVLALFLGTLRMAWLNWRAKAAFRTAWDAAEPERLAEHQTGEALRERLRNAEANDDAEVLAALLEIELSNEELPFDLEFDLDFNGVREVSIDLTLPVSSIPTEQPSFAASNRTGLKQLPAKERDFLCHQACEGLALRLMYEAFRVLPMLDRVELVGHSDHSPLRPKVLTVSATRAEFQALDMNLAEYAPVYAMARLGGRFSTDGKAVPVEIA